MIAFMLYHGDHLVNTLGAEINQIEESIKVRHLYLYSLLVYYLSFYQL